MDNSKVKVLYIAGEGRSGSTILGSLLGEISGFLFVGELMSIWKHFYIENNACTCGTLPSECSIWKQIIYEGFGHIDKQLAIKMEYYRRYYIKNRRIISFLHPNLQQSLYQEASDYLNYLELLYCSIKNVVNVDFIVDDPKNPTYGKLLEQIPVIDLYVIHLIRDPRAVAYSWQRKKIQTDGKKNVRLMFQFNPLVSAYRWNIHNLSTSLLLRTQPEKYYVQRYEDFVNNPKQAVENILKFLKITGKSLPFESKDSVRLTGNHAVWGNPVRHLTGVIEIKNDDEWIKSFKGYNRRLVGLLTTPLRKKYGYK